MSIWSAALAIVLGLGAGVFAGMFGVGGGILFVPTLVALGLGEVEAAATSLLAIVPTSAVGIWRQARYGHVQARTSVIVGVASVAGVWGGVELATRLPEDALRRMFGVLLLAVAGQLVWQVRKPGAGRK